MTRTIQITSEAGYLIPMKDITKDEVDAAKKRFLYRFYKDSVCRKCEYLEDRHSENCDSCEAFTGARQMSKTVVFKNEEHLSIPRGQKQFAVKLASKVKGVTEVTVKTAFSEARPMRRKINPLPDFEIRDYQDEAVEVAFKKRRGILKSPPRSGKTLMGAILSCKVGEKTLILASQREWLVQFKETYYGSRTQRGFTDAKPGQVDFARKFEDFERLDVCLCTFAQFFREKGKALLQKIRSLFGLVLIDECFPQDYLVLTRSGKLTLQEVKVGDEVLSFNHESKKAEFKRVLNKKFSLRDDLLEVVVNGVSYSCTPEHPWYCENRQGYVMAKDLKPGDRVVLRTPVGADSA